MTEEALTQIPLTQSEKLIWMGQSLAGNAPLYNMAWHFDLHLELDKDIFAKAFEQVCANIDALRLTFSQSGADPIQTVSDDPIQFPPALDFSAEENPVKAAKIWTGKRARRTLDLSQSNYDTCLIKLKDDHWVWFFNQHHIATDAWSGSLIFKAVSAAYEKLLTGDNTASPGLPQFSDYAIQPQNLLPDIQDYWRAKASDAPSGAVPYGGVRDTSNPSSTRLKIDFGKHRTDAIKAMAVSGPFRSISPDLSIFTLMMTAYAAFLSRVTNQTSLSIATPSHNRPSPSHKETAGLFIEMFPLNLDLEADLTFSDLFKSTLAETMGFLRHAKLGASTAATAASANAVLNYIPVNYGQFAGAPTQINWLHPNAHDAGHDLRLHVYDFEGGGEFTVEMDCNDSAISKDALSQIPSHFLTIVDALLDRPDQIISKLPLVQPDSPEAALAMQFGANVPFTHPTILDAVDAQTSATPDAIAIECNGDAVSYRDLATRSDAVAAHLIDQGLKPEEPVLLHAKRSINLVASILGVLKAGGFFVPVPSETPSDRLDTICRLANPKLIMNDAEIAAITPTAKTALPNIKPDQTAYAIFTSGSTGEPKGVEVEHRNLNEYVRWAAGSFGSKGPKSYPLYSSIGFDLTITSIFTPLVTGGKVIIYPEPSTPTDLSILEVFKDDRVDVVKLTPAHLSLLCENRVQVDQISTLVLGGENLTTTLCNQALKTISPDLEIINEYGPTEAVVGCMIHRFKPEKDTGSSVPIGRPADNSGILILDAGLNPVPTGVTGEIYISGRLARGYLNRADLTKERFISHYNRTLYRTGDLARTDFDGTIHYLGRADTQLKIGGVRVEPAEIEAAFSSIPDVNAVFATSYQQTRPKFLSNTTSCSNCGITDNFPDTTIGADGICGICSGFDAYKDRAQVYFKTPEDLSKIVAGLPKRKTGKYDAIVLLSGGKDSTYALYRFVELTSNILALTLDNGFISDGAKRNIKRVTGDLGVDHRFMTTPAMNAIFNESLTKHSNVCQGCFKTIYTLALETARDEGIPAVVTGLSRGQFFETRLTPELFENRSPSGDDLDMFVRDARKSYHRTDDAISRNLGVTFDDAMFDQIEIIDIYRYLDVPVSELYTYLDQRGAWTRPDDTGRSTNCLINDVGIYVHKKREGFHNYALPYSWDVRMGHKTRQEAVQELDDEIDTSRVNDILSEIGFDQSLLNDHTQTQLVVYVSGKDLSETTLRARVSKKLLSAIMPAHIIVLDELPLTSNGKVDTAALPKPESHRTAPLLKVVAPTNETERHLARIYQDVLKLDTISIADNFYDMGGDSIAAIQIAILASDQGLQMDPNAVFEHQTIRELAEHVQTLTDDEKTKPINEPLLDLGTDDFAAIAKQISGAS